MDINAVIDGAIANEVEAHEFYTKVSERSTNASVKRTFAELAADELSHKKFLEGCRVDPTQLQKIQTGPDYKVAEATELPELSIDMKPADALALAMKKEQEAARFYEGLAANAKDAVTRSMFENLARMEIGHKTRIEDLFVNIGYPEVF